mmetsp:Transcript_12840/g.20974  ORF Transcript_12840/g.20974 Transcript_12840/m.20974 type:complete len:243 (+) Transcript_12840:318-1046(+)
MFRKTHHSGRTKRQPIRVRSKQPRRLFPRLEWYQQQLCNLRPIRSLLLPPLGLPLLLGMLHLSYHISQSTSMSSAGDIRGSGQLPSQSPVAINRFAGVLFPYHHLGRDCIVLGYSVGADHLRRTTGRLRRIPTSTGRDAPGLCAAGPASLLHPHSGPAIQPSHRSLWKNIRCGHRFRKRQCGFDGLWHVRHSLSTPVAINRQHPNTQSFFNITPRAHTHSSSPRNNPRGHSYRRHATANQPS